MTTFPNSLLAFSKAIGVGVLVAAGITGAAVAGLSRSAELGTYAFITAGVIAFAFLMVGCVLFGLPLTFLLKRRKIESQRAYIFAGALIGYLIMPGYFVLTDGEVSGSGLGLLGALAGALTGRTWWRSHRRYASAEFLIRRPL
jgi:hypothetical protein